MLIALSRLRHPSDWDFEDIMDLLEDNTDLDAGSCWKLLEMNVDNSKVKAVKLCQIAVHLFEFECPIVSPGLHSGS